MSFGPKFPGPGNAPSESAGFRPAMERRSTWRIIGRVLAYTRPYAAKRKFCLWTHRGARPAEAGGRVALIASIIKGPISAWRLSSDGRPIDGASRLAGVHRALYFTCASATSSNSGRLSSTTCAMTSSKSLQPDAANCIFHAMPNWDGS